MDPREPSSPKWWEEKLVADYREHRWRQLMEPMCRKLENAPHS
jgi:16S rRNA C967 or C1407 C5-methylase (RsmB/RsmF family)